MELPRASGSSVEVVLVEYFGTHEFYVHVVVYGVQLAQI